MSFVCSSPAVLLNVTKSGVHFPIRKNEGKTFRLYEPIASSEPSVVRSPRLPLIYAMVYYFGLSGGLTAYMGKDKYENEELIAHGWPEDIWFHGAYLNVLRPRFHTARS